jgi:hypothetical protein
VDLNRFHGRYELPFCAVAGKPGRSLCQYVTLHLDLTQFAAQLRQFEALIGSERSRLAWRSAMGNASHTHPAQDAGGVTAKLFGQLAGFAASSNQLDHLLSKLRRVRRFGIGHIGLLLQEQ